MKSILIGNGINIELGGMEYSNKKIIARLLSNLQTNDYSNVFENSITNPELNNVFYCIYKELRNILKGEYDQYCNTSDEIQTLERFKQQYNFTSSIFDVGIEDYFFILRVYHHRFKDDNDKIRATFDGFCWLFLDSIYNGGKIQKISDNIKDAKYKKLYEFFNGFDNIFTVNYDCTIEKISNKNVHYLHGDFNTLADQYDSNTLMGKVYADRGDNNPVTEQYKHIYSNAIMGFNGNFKENTMNIFENAEFGIESFMQNNETGLSIDDREKMEILRTSTDKKSKFIYDIYQTKKKFPSMVFHQYPSGLFKSISDELCIVGLSPINDDHIWRILKANNQLKKIIYYYKYEQDKKLIEKLYPDMNIVTISVDDLW